MHVQFVPYETKFRQIFNMMIMTIQRNLLNIFITHATLLARYGLCLSCTGIVSKRTNGSSELLAQRLMLVIRYDTMRDAILRCARKPT